MAHTKSALKRIRTSQKNRLVNRHNRSRMKVLIKSVLNEQDKQEALKKMSSAVSFLDKMVLKKLIHKNKASNQKSRLMSYVNKLN